MFSKKKQGTEPQIIQATNEQKQQKTQNKQSQKLHNSQNNYGESDAKQQFVNEAGKVGKAVHNFFRETQKVKQKGGDRAIPLFELSQHTTASSAWLSLNGTVYDVTQYIKYHPGGKLILQGCGKQCCQLFNKYHSWVNGPLLLAKYKLGYLSG